MSLDRSLRGANALIRHRNVLTRTERLAKLTEEERWNDTKSVFGLPKVAHRKQAVVKTVKEDAAAVPGATPAAGAAGAAAPAAGAAGAKGAAPAGGKAAPAGGKAPAAGAAKAAAPAAKKK